VGQLVKISTRWDALQHADAWERHAQQLELINECLRMRADFCEALVAAYTAEIERLRELLK